MLLSLVLFVIVKTQGYVSGREFSPTHFQQRDFSFYEIPLIQLQITPIKRKGSTPQTAVYLRQNSLIKTYTGVPKIWHLVSISRGLTGSTPADANLLLDQLNLRSSGDAYWRKWSMDHAKHAQVLWPVVQKLSQRELYILIPELFELAQLEQTPEQLAARIDRWLPNRYHSLVRDMQASNRLELAQQLLDEAIVDYPDDPQIRKLRSQPAPHRSTECGPQT